MTFKLVVFRGDVVTGTRRSPTGVSATPGYEA